jgi:hypothetical protein
LDGDDNTSWENRGASSVECLFDSDTINAADENRLRLRRRALHDLGASADQPLEQFDDGPIRSPVLRWRRNADLDHVAIPTVDLCPRRSRDHPDVHNDTVAMFDYGFHRAKLRRCRAYSLEHEPQHG